MGRIVCVFFREMDTRDQRHLRRSGSKFSRFFKLRCFPWPSMKASLCIHSPSLSLGSWRDDVLLAAVQYVA